MQGSTALSATGLIMVLLASCAAPEPFVRESSPDEVEISSGDNLAAATALARAHCARFERTARLRRADTETAVFDCIKP